MVWGSNLFQTNEEGVIGIQLRRALDQGSKLIVIDPRKTVLASKADLWLQPSAWGGPRPCPRDAQGDL